MKFDSYSIYLADVPFEEGIGSKLRPVVMINDLAYVVEVSPITSNTSRPEDYVIKYWKEAGLKKPSAIQLQYLVRLTPDMVGRKIGKLDAVDIIELKRRR